MRRNTVCVIHSYSTVPGIQEIFYGCLLVLRMNRWLMNWSLLQLGVLEESNAASLNYWHFAKVPKQADYSPSTWSWVLESWAGRTAPRDPSGLGLTGTVNPMVGAQLWGPEDTSGFILGSGKMSLPFPVVRNTSLPWVPVAPFLPWVSAVPFTLKVAVENERLCPFWSF